MAEKKKSKKVNHLTLKECEDIIVKLGGQLQCQYVQKVLERQQQLLVKKQFDKN
jgi:hypothetical protein